MQAKDQILNYQSIIDDLRKQKADTVANEADATAYFQLLMMSELCDKLLFLLTDRNLSTITEECFDNYKFDLNNARSLETILARFIENEYQDFRQLLFIGKCVFVGLPAIFFLYNAIYLAAALAALTFTFHTLFLLIFCGLTAFSAMRSYAILDKATNSLAFIKEFVVESDPKKIYSKKLSDNTDCTESIYQSIYELRQGFFNSKSDTSKTLADDVFEAYQSKVAIR